MKIGIKIDPARDSEVALHSPKHFSNPTSMPVHAGKDKKPSHTKHKPNPALDFSTPRYTRSGSAAQKKMDQVKDTEAKDKILDTQIFEVEDLDSDIVNTMDSHVVIVAMTPPPKVIGGTASSSATPKWLTTSVRKKRSFIPVSIPIQDMVVKYTEKGPKQKKFKTTARLDADEKTGKWVAGIASYKPKDENKEVNAEDFEVTKVELENMGRDSDNHLFQVSAKKMLTRSEKYGQAKES